MAWHAVRALDAAGPLISLCRFKVPPWVGRTSPFRSLIDCPLQHARRYARGGGETPEPEAWATLRHVLDLIEARKVDGDPQAVFAAIEEDLRARMAVPIELPLSKSR